MKKISFSLVGCLYATQLFAFDWSSLTNSFNDISSLLGESDVSKTVTQCYKPNVAIPSIDDMCSLIDFSYNTSVDLCSVAPNIIGLSKVSSTEQVGYSTQALKDYCSSIGSNPTEKLKNVVTNANIWTAQNDDENDVAFPSGDSMADFYRGTAPVLDFNKIVENKNKSIVSSYFLSKDKNHQATAKYLVDLAKIKHVGDVTQITTSDVGVAKDMIEYEQEVKALSGTVNSDLMVSSPSAISSNLSSKISSYTDSSGQSSANSTANSEIQDVKQIIENNARAKKGLLKELLSSEDDLAIPTQQTLELYNESVRPKYAMLIRKQQAREAYINAIVDTETKLKKDIAELTAKKAVIMKYSFDSASAMNEIDSLVQ
jgi:hypothetical protein